MSDVLYVSGACFCIMLIRVQIPLLKFCLSRRKTLRTWQPLKGFCHTFPQCVQNCSKSHINEIKRSVNSSSANSRPSNLAIVKTWRIQKKLPKKPGDFAKILEISVDGKLRWLKLKNTPVVALIKEPWLPFVGLNQANFFLICTASDLCKARP